MIGGAEIELVPTSSMAKVNVNVHTELERVVPMMGSLHVSFRFN